jgi:asparagine synthetase B (glutamine-hydrolysing)
VRHGSVVGVHNGIVFNDEEIMAAHGFERAHREMTVDSEAIFALLEASEGHAHVLEQCQGSLAIAWLDERRPNVLYAARGVGRPLWIGRGRHETFLASTRRALEVVERYVGVSLAKRELPEGSLLAREDGRVAWRERFRPYRGFHEDALPAVRAPHEGRTCLSLLATLAAAA